MANAGLGEVGPSSRSTSAKARLKSALIRLRHFCASHLYEKGMDLKAIQELLGHAWLSTSSRYIHVHDGHIEQSWAAANDRVIARYNDPPTNNPSDEQERSTDAVEHADEGRRSRDLEVD